MNQLLTQRNSLSQKKEYAKAEIRASDGRAASLQRELDRMGVNEGQEAILKSKLDDKEQRYAQAEDSFKNSGFGDRIQMENSTLRNVEENLERVTSELARGTRQADERARLGLLKKELETRRTALETL